VGVEAEAAQGVDEGVFYLVCEIVMKAFILAAGHGTRLRPITERTAKCLLPIQGVPLLQIWLDNCKRSGVTDVLVNAHSHAGQVRECARLQASEVRIVVSEEKELLGSAGTLAENREFVAAEQEFFVLYGDVLTNMDLTELLRLHREKGMTATLGVYRVPDPRRCGIVELDGTGVVSRFVEKPEHPNSDLAFAGVMVAGPDIFDYIPQERPADIGFHLLPKLVGKMAAMEVQGFLLDIGTMENYRAAERSWPGLAATSRSSKSRGVSC
jgi:mannose-1-phosphate guanylyltransferase